MEKTTVAQLMTKDPTRLRAQDSALRAFDLMSERHFRHVPIVDDEENLVGLVTDRDLLRHAMASLSELPMSEQRRFLDKLEVREVMTVEPESIGPDSDVTTAGQMLIEQKFGCLPVCEGQRLVGIITETDFVKYVVADA